MKNEIRKDVQIKTTKKNQLSVSLKYIKIQSNNESITAIINAVRKANLYDFFKRIAMIPN